MWPKKILLAAALVVTGLVPAPPALAANPTHVAIVIAGHGVACVSWHSGITGDEVLNDVATVKYRPTDGLITQIDGQPKNNRADDTHYWSYWHNTGSGWKYSTVGASGYHPKAGTVEGWHFISGSPTATPPPVRSYASICHDTATAPPPATTTPHASASVTRTSTAPRTSAHPTAERRSTSERATPTTVPTTAAPSAAATESTTAASTPGSVSVGPTSDLPTLQLRATGEAKSNDGGSALPTVLVVGLVLVLGAAAAFVSQRRRRNP